MSVENKLRALKPGRVSDTRRSLTHQEALELIRAYRRGVPLEDIGKAIGRGRANVYAVLGTWALRHAALPEDSER